MHAGSTKVGVRLGALLAIFVSGLLVARQPLASLLGSGRLGFRQLSWEAPQFQGLAQDGRPVSEASLRGHPWISSFVFTRCLTACPLITAKLRLLEREIDRPDIRFVSFSVDPDFDTPEVLRGYAAKWGPTDSRWTLVSADRHVVGAVASGFKVAVGPSGDPADPILQTSLLFLVDGSGQVRGAYDSTDATAMRELRVDASSVDRSSPATRGPSDSVAPSAQQDETEATASREMRGRDLFASLGCGGCHDDARVAPSLRGLYGQNVALEGGSTVRANALYIQDSIRAPSRLLVAGYGPTMPSYADFVSDEQLELLVAFVTSLSSSEGGPEPAATRATTEIDPECGMTVTVTDNTPRATRDGKHYFFCSDLCRDRFLRTASVGH